jgi:hypothetical protein
MMRANLMRLVPFAAALLLAGVACDAESSGTGNDGRPDEIDNAGKEDGVIRPVGTFGNDAAVAGQPTLLVLKSDKTYHMATLVYCFRAPCDPIGDDGTYKYSLSRGTRYIRLYDAAGDLRARYAYTFADDVLSLRLSGTEDWFDMTHSSEPWCSAPGDCELQDLITPMCVGEFECADNACAFRCGIAIPSCTEAGGECVALGPHGCPSGTEPGDASEYSCGPEGALGMMCCLPVAEPNACETAGGMCVGLRPDACPDGYENANAEDYPCGPPGMLGTTCCLPRAACRPRCGAVGSRSEGWYDGCTGELICWTSCAGAEATCGAIGSRSEGWYSSAGTGSGCGGGALIRWDRCAS